MSTPPKLQMSGVSKSFPGVHALQDVSITVHKGEVLGLVGVNGAGKSTLMNVLGGIDEPDAGTIEIDGVPADLHSPVDADTAGIAFIHQELLFFSSLTVAENMFISHLPSSRLPFIVDRQAATTKAGAALEMLDSGISPGARMEELSVGEKQVVEIARALAMGSDIVIFDEPSSSLSIREKERLFAIVRRLRKEGKAVIYISHFLDEIMELCDSYAVLRNGRLAGAGSIEDVTKERFVEMIVGESVGEAGTRERRKGGVPLLQIEGIEREPLLRNVGFTLHAGEVLGLWGLLGSGRTELFRAILGLDPMSGGKLVLFENGSPRPIMPRELLAWTGYVTESRRTDGLFLEEAVWKNISATTLAEYAHGRMRVLDKAAEATTARKFINSLRIRTPGYQTRTAILSGGNQQKVVFSKWLAKQPRILMLDEPTRGVDVGAKREIGDLIGGLADEGAAVLLVTSEIEEMVAISDRVLVLRDGVIADEIIDDRITETALMASAMGTLSPDA